MNTLNQYRKMKHTHPIIIILCLIFVCVQGETASASSSISQVESPKIQNATKEQISRSMLVHHFFKDFHKPQSTKKGTTDIFFVTYEPTGLDPRKSFYEFSPAIIIKSVDRTPPQFIIWPKLAKYNWVGAGQLSELGYYWGFLDYGVEGLSSELTIVGSQDFGVTWRKLSSVKKFYFADEFESFTMVKSGRGTLTLKRSAEGVDHTKGFDVYPTSDFGKTWSKPTFQASDVDLFKSTYNAECTFSIKPKKRIPSICGLSSYFQL